MATSFKFELVSPERVLLSETVEEVVIPGAEGQFTVLGGHAPVVSTLKPGIIEVKLADKRRRIYVRGGFAEVEPDRLTVLAEQAFDVADLGADGFAREIKAAEEALSSATDDQARFLASSALASLQQASNQG